MENSSNFLRSEKKSTGTKKEIAPGIILYRDPSNDAEFPVRYSSHFEIGEVKYTVHVFLRDDRNPVIFRPVYEIVLAVGKDEQTQITGKGLAAFSKVVEKIAEMLLVLHQKEKINRVKFTAVPNSFSPEKTKEVEIILSNAYRKDNAVFDGFSWVGHKGHKKINIEKGMLVVKRGSNVQMGSLSSIFNAPNAAENNFLFLLDPEILPLLLKFIGDTSQVTQSFQKKNENQRMQLFTRTLKNRFPDLRTDIKKDTVLMYLDSLDKKKS